MGYYLGGHRILRAGWAGPTAVYVDFATQHTSGFLWQLYANRQLIGSTEISSDRRVYGQLLPSAIPAPLTLVRVDPGSVLESFGARLPRQPWNRFALTWNVSDFVDDLHHFDITASEHAGGEIVEENILARVPYTGDGTYRFVIPPLEASGTWKFGITPRDDALPFGNDAMTEEVEIIAAVPPPDVEFDDDGNRFSLSAEAGVVTASFAWPD